MKPPRKMPAFSVYLGRPRSKVFEPPIRAPVSLSVPPWLLVKSAPEAVPVQRPGAEPPTEGTEP